MKLLCVKCQTEMKPFCYGVQVVEMFNTPPEPYRLWYADEYQCPGCGFALVTQFGDKPAWEYFEGPLPLQGNSPMRYEDYERPKVEAL